MKIKNLLLLLICLAANSAIISNLECTAAAGAGDAKVTKENAEKPLQIESDEAAIVYPKNWNKFDLYTKFYIGSHTPDYEKTNNMGYVYMGYSKDYFFKYIKSFEIKDRIAFVFKVKNQSKETNSPITILSFQAGKEAHKIQPGYIYFIDGPEDIKHIYDENIRVKEEKA